MSELITKNPFISLMVVVKVINILYDPEDAVLKQKLLFFLVLNQSI